VQVSCIPLCFGELIRAGKMTPSEWIGIAADIGLDGVEIYRAYLASTERSYLEQLAAEAERAGLGISMYTSYAELASPREEDRLAQIASLRKDVDVAVGLHTRIVRVTAAGRWPEGYTREQALRNVADGLRMGLDYAEEHGVMLALEDHPEIGTSIQDFIAILALVDDPRLKVNLDTANPLDSGDSPVELAELVKQRVVHVHASDVNYKLEHQVVGAGCVPFPEVFRVLKSFGYDGWVSLEAYGTRGKQDIIDGMQYVRKVWDEV